MKLKHALLGVLVLSMLPAVAEARHRYRGHHGHHYRDHGYRSSRGGFDLSIGFGSRYGYSNFGYSRGYYYDRPRYYDCSPRYYSPRVYHYYDSPGYYYRPRYYRSYDYGYRPRYYRESYYYCD
jgi:hypothetical protein